MSEPDDKPAEKKLTPWKQFLEDVSWDIAFFRAFGNLLLGILYEEGKGVKSGWFAFIVFTGIAFWGGCHYSARNIDERLSGITNYFGGELSKKDGDISKLNGQLAESRQDAETARSNFKIDLSDANRQRDSALQRLDFFEANPEKLSEIYSNIFANAPTNFQQFDLAFQQFTNAVQGINSEKAILGLAINRTNILTNVDITAYRLIRSVKPCMNAFKKTP